MTKEEIVVTASKKANTMYDQVAKENLHYPMLIAPILKAVVPEYKNYTVDEIVDYIIKDSICDDAIDDVSAIANQMESELSSISEKLIRYDSRFKAINPYLSDKIITVYLHIDLEVQNNYHPSSPSYPIIKRAIYYGAREISSQLGVLTDSTTYNDIEKVYSIWICNENIPLKLQNTVTSYKITKHDEIGVSDEPEKDYDLLHVILIRRGNDEGTEEIFDYLTAFFTSDIEKICKHVNIKADKSIVEGVRKMTGLGDSIYRKGIQQGIQQGLNDTLVSLVKDGLLQLSEAARRSNMSEEAFSALLEKDTNDVTRSNSSH